MEQIKPDKNDFVKGQNADIEGIENVDFEKEINFITSPEKPTIAIIEKEVNGEQYFTGHFAYRLECIGKPHTKEEEEKMLTLSLDFHRNLSSILNNHYPFASFTIRIINAPDRKAGINQKYPIEITFIARIYSNSLQVLKENLNHLSDELKLFMQKKNVDNTPTLFFYPIINESDLQDSIGRKTPLYAVCTRASIQLKKNVKVGFNKSVDESKSICLPKPIKVQDFSLASLMKILSCLNQYAEVNLVLCSAKLKESSKQQIREVISQSGLLSEEFTDENDRKEYVAYCRKFIHDNPLFYAGITFSSNNAMNNNVLRNAISNAFTNSYEVFKLEDQKSQKYLLGEFIEFEQPKLDLRFLYTIDDVVSAFRFPIPKMDGISGIENKSNSFYYLPDNLPDNGILIGQKKLTGKHFDIKITKEDLARHLFVMGKTGTAKSTLLKTGIMHLINSGEGCGLIDPGDLYESIANKIPEKRKNDVILFDPTDVENKIRFNILEYNPLFPEQKTLICNEIFSNLNDIYDMKACGGPMFETYLKSFIFLVMDTIKGTLADVVKAFECKEFRNELLAICNDKNLKTKILNMLDATGEQSFVNFIPYITSKLNRFVDDHYIGPIISEKSNISFREIMDEKKILLIKLPKGRLGSEGTSFLGRILFNRILLAAYSRENIAEKSRVDFTCFIDEFQNFTSNDVCSAFAEARKYHFNMVVATQTLSVLEKKVINSLLGNVGSIVCFRTGIIDAEYILPYLSPQFSIGDLLELPDYNAVCRLLVKNIPSKPFVFTTIP